MALTVGEEVEGDVLVGLGSDADVWPRVLECRSRPLFLFFFFLGAMRERDASSFARRSIAS